MLILEVQELRNDRVSRVITVNNQKRALYEAARARVEGEIIEEDEELERRMEIKLRAADMREARIT